MYIISHLGCHQSHQPLLLQACRHLLCSLCTHSLDPEMSSEWCTRSMAEEVFWLPQHTPIPGEQIVCMQQI